MKTVVLRELKDLLQIPGKDRFKQEIIPELKDLPLLPEANLLKKVPEILQGNQQLSVQTQDKEVPQLEQDLLQGPHDLRPLDQKIPLDREVRHEM